MTIEPNRRVLIAGIGNIFFGDDGFGVEVAVQLGRRSLPAGVRVVDFGIRGLHLAYDMLEHRYDEVIFVDAVQQQAPPGTVVLFEPTGDDLADPAPDPHAMGPAVVLALLRSIGGTLPRVLVVGCEPDTLAPGIGLSPVVEAAVGPAVQAIIALMARSGLQVAAVEPGSCVPELKTETS